jgi:hypothetical protein
MFDGRIKATRRKWILWNVSYDDCSQVVKSNWINKLCNYWGKRMFDIENHRVQNTHCIVGWWRDASKLGDMKIKSCEQMRLNFQYAYELTFFI